MTTPTEQAGSPLRYLEVACLDELPGWELAGRRALLLRALGSAGRSGADGALATALSLASVIAEQDIRARTYAMHADTPHGCSCGFRCRGLAAMDEHLDQFPDDEAHDEIWRELV